MLKILTVLVTITIICIKIKPNEPDDIDIILNSEISTEVKIERPHSKMLTFKFNKPVEKIGELKIKNTLKNLIRQ